MYDIIFRVSDSATSAVRPGWLSEKFCVDSDIVECLSPCCFVGWVLCYLLSGKMLFFTFNIFLGITPAD